MGPQGSTVCLGKSYFRLSRKIGQEIILKVIPENLHVGASQRALRGVPGGPTPGGLGPRLDRGLVGSVLRRRPRAVPDTRCNYNGFRPVS